MNGKGAVVWPGSAAAERLRVRVVPEQIAGILRAEIVRGDIMPGAMLLPATRGRWLGDRITGPQWWPRARLPDLVVASRHIGLYLQVPET